MTSSRMMMPLRAGSSARRTVVARWLQRQTLVAFAALVLVGTASLSVAAKEAAAADKTTDASSASEPTTCGLYLALSSRTDDDGNKWGVYAGHGLVKGDNIGTPEVAIHLHNLRANNIFGKPAADDSAREKEEQQEEKLLKAVEFLEESFWVPDSLGGKFEVETGRIITATPGVGFLGAFDVSLTSADWNVRQNYQRIPVGEVTGDPHESRGAISPFYNIQLWVTADKVVSGSEIFIHYGSNWQEEQVQSELLSADFARIDETVGQMIEFFAKHSQELDDASKKEIYQFITKDVMDAAVGHTKATKIARILPDHPDELPQIPAAGGTLMYSQPSVFRTTEWLQTNGRCMDHIRMGPSTVPGAGRGAFANRALTKGTIVGSSPLLHLPDGAVLDMHELVAATEGGDLVRASNEVVDRQLLVNYCYGHPESTMLLFPAGGGINWINHGDKPNVKLAWSDHAAHHKGWFAMDPSELLEPDFRHLGLILEVVALRDIAEGEEILLDYGPEWKQAWKEHQDGWKESVKSGELPKKWPIRAVDLNAEYLKKPYKTEAELKKAPYPQQTSLAAFLMLGETEEVGTREDPKTWTLPPTGSVYSPDNLFKVVVIDRMPLDAGAFNYTIRWTNSKGEHTYVKTIPHDAFVFVDEPESGDQFVEGAFRHPIGIPDDAFPQGPWRNAAGAATKKP